MSLILDKPKPNIEQFIEVIRGKTIPQRPPLIEYAIDFRILRTVTEGLLGREWVEPNDNDRESMQRFLDNYIAFFYHLGYDFVRLERGAGFWLPTRTIPDTGTGGQTDRNWAEMEQATIASWEDFERYPWPESDPDVWILDYICKHLPEGMGLITCHCGGIFEHLSRLFTYEGLCLALYDRPDLVEAVAVKIQSCMERYYQAFLQLDGIKMVLQGDDMGHRGGLLVSRAHIEKYCIPCHKRFAEITHARGIPYCLHSCGRVMELMPVFIEDVGIDGKHSFEDVIMPAADFYDCYGDRIAVLGGIDVNLLTVGTPDEVRQETRKLIEHCAPRGRFAIGSGNSIPSYVPAENYFAMVEEARR